RSRSASARRAATWLAWTTGTRPRSAPPASDFSGKRRSRCRPVPGPPAPPRDRGHSPRSNRGPLAPCEDAGGGVTWNCDEGDPERRGGTVQRPGAATAHRAIGIRERRMRAPLVALSQRPRRESTAEARGEPRLEGFGPYLAWRSAVGRKLAVA